MPLTNAEFAVILEDASKRIEGNIHWAKDEDHSSSLEFRAEVQTDVGWPLFVCGSYNQPAGTLTYALILKTQGRIYALDMGKDHHNPQCEQVGERHKHRWSEQYRDKEAFIPNEITAAVSDPVAVWKQFCAVARIRHGGTLDKPPPQQMEMFG